MVRSHELGKQRPITVTDSCGRPTSSQIDTEVLETERAWRQVDLAVAATTPTISPTGRFYTMHGVRTQGAPSTVGWENREISQ
ncbi:hypothetical protein RRG08_035846 [Elysia crispata]|uniref:Uncharacterized protein n=1 Tax=Elysia crispata TaxID=231223 RepID=A0AAE0Z5H4_9GAST|nr:hypothetical protein RRG08_035846 [Elysia crispata]